MFGLRDSAFVASAVCVTRGVPASDAGDMWFSLGRSGVSRRQQEQRPGPRPPWLLHNLGPSLIGSFVSARFDEVIDRMCLLPERRRLAARQLLPGCRYPILTSSEVSNVANAGLRRAAAPTASSGLTGAWREHLGCRVSSRGKTQQRWQELVPPPEATLTDGPDPRTFGGPTPLRRSSISSRS